MRMNRLVCAAALGLATMTALSTAGVARADNPDAELHNNKGRELYSAANYSAAQAEFEIAVKYDPQAKYYFNLCASLEKQGQPKSALDACTAARNAAPAEALRPKIEQKIAALTAQVNAGQGGNTYVPPAGGQLPPNGGGTYVPPPPVSNRPRGAWGIDIGYANNLSLAEGSFRENYSTSGVAVGFHGTYWFSHVSKLSMGLHGWLAYSQFRAKDGYSDYSITVPTFGAGLAVDLNLTPRIAVGGFAGAGLGFPGIQSESGEENDRYVAPAVRFQGSAKFFLSPKHAIVVTPVGLDVVLPAFTNGSSSDTPPARVKLDKTSQIYQFMIGYQGYFGGGSSY